MEIRATFTEDELKHGVSCICLSASMVSSRCYSMEASGNSGQFVSSLKDSMLRHANDSLSESTRNAEQKAINTLKLRADIHGYVPLIDAIAEIRKVSEACPRVVVNEEVCGD